MSNAWRPGKPFPFVADAPPFTAQHGGRFADSAATTNRLAHELWERGGRPGNHENFVSTGVNDGDLRGDVAKSTRHPQSAQPVLSRFAETCSISDRRVLDLLPQIELETNDPLFDGELWEPVQAWEECTNMTRAAIKRCRSRRPLSQSSHAQSTGSKKPAIIQKEKARVTAIRLRPWTRKPSTGAGALPGRLRRVPPGSRPAIGRQRSRLDQAVSQAAGRYGRSRSRLLGRDRRELKPVNGRAIRPSIDGCQRRKGTNDQDDKGATGRHP
jgi:hypothetical protein